MGGVDDSVDEVRALIRALRHTPFRGPDPFGVVTAESLTTLWRQISAAAFILSLLIASVSLGRRRDRDHEHHAGGGGGADARDRRAPGPGRAQARRPPPVPARRPRCCRWPAASPACVLGGLAALGVRGLLDFPAQVTPGIVMLGIVLAIGVGLAAGYWPARSASNLAVVDALRDE